MRYLPVRRTPVALTVSIDAAAPDEVAVKQIEAIVRPEKLEDVMGALAKLGQAGLTVSRVRGHGAQGGVRQMWRRKEYLIDLLPKARIVVVVPDSGVSRAVDAICSAAHTGLMGDGKIFVTTVEEVVRVRTGERDADALLGEPDVRSLPPRTHLMDAEAS